MRRLTNDSKTFTLRNEVLGTRVGNKSIMNQVRDTHNMVRIDDEINKKMSLILLN